MNVKMLFNTTSFHLRSVQVQFPIDYVIQFCYSSSTVECNKSYH